MAPAEATGSDSCHCSDAQPKPELDSPTTPGGGRGAIGLSPTLQSIFSFLKVGLPRRQFESKALDLALQFLDFRNE